MDCADWVKMFSDGSVGLAALATAWVARKGVDAWSRELRGRAQFEAARSLFKAVLKLRDALQAARSPFISAAEFPDAYRAAGLNPDAKTEADGYAHVLNARWAPVWEAYREVETQALEAEALWGADVRGKVDAVKAVVRTVNAAIHAFMRNLQTGGEDFKANPPFGQKVRSEVFGSDSDDESELNKRLRTAVQAVEEEMRPHLRRDKAD